MNSSIQPLRPIFPGQTAILHGADYNPEQWREYPPILEEDRRLRRLAGMNVMSIGIFSWSDLEPREGHWNFGWLDRVMDDLAADGMKAILATPSAARPGWLAEKYPEVRRVDRSRQREPYNSRHNFCWSSPVYREKVEIINTRLAERYGRHPALALWHVSNELGGHPGSGECFCDLCLARWHRWLEERYGTLDRLNEAWWSSFWSHRFSRWEEINPSDPTLDACTLDWSRFVNAQMKEWLEFESAILRRHTPDVPITTNFMGTHEWIDYAELAQAVDVVADDQYPCLYVGKTILEDNFMATAFKHELYRCFRPDRAFMLMESCPETPQWTRPQALKHEHLHRAEMLQAIGHGADGTCYFQWRKGRGGFEKLHGAVVDHLGTEATRTFQLVKRLSESYSRLGEVLAAPRQAQAALLYDHDSRRALALTNGIAGGPHAYIIDAQEHYRPWWRRGLAVNIMDSRRAWDAHRVVIAPQLFLLHEGVAARLRRYVEDGGILVATCLTGWVDESNRCLLGGWPGEGLRQVFGLWHEETEWLDDGATLAVDLTQEDFGPLTGTSRRMAARIHAQGAEVLGRFRAQDSLLDGAPALLRHRFGRGTAYFIAGEFDRALLGACYAAVIREAGIKPPLGGELPEGLVFSSRQGSEGEYWFISNLLNREQSLPLPAGRHAVSLWDGQSAPGVLHLPAWGDGVWRVA